MRVILEKISDQIKDKKTLILIRWVILFTGTIYLMRSKSDEFSLLLETSILVIFFCFTIIPIIGIAIYLTGLLIYKVLRHGFVINGSFIPTLTFIVCTFLAVKLPLPPLAEEASYLKYQKDYEHVVALAKSKQLKHGNRCSTDDYSYKVPEGYEHLSESCVFVYDYSGSFYVEFKPYSYPVSLYYFENPDDVTKSRDCDFRGIVWKKINKNWYVCKLSHTW